VGQGLGPRLGPRLSRDVWLDPAALAQGQDAVLMRMLGGELNAAGGLVWVYLTTFSFPFFFEYKFEL
jgi:hypothetical protein